MASHMLKVCACVRAGCPCCIQGTSMASHMLTVCDCMRAGCPCCIQGTSMASQVDLEDDPTGELKRSCKLLTQALLGEGPICGGAEARATPAQLPQALHCAKVP